MRWIKHDINHIQGPGLQVGMSLTTAEHKHIPDPDGKRATPKRHYTGTAIDDDDFPELVPVTGIGGMIGGSDNR
jgi:hypothetical protein